MSSNVNKPPILDGTGQDIKTKLSAILQALQGAGSAVGTKYGYDDAAETTLADDDKVPFYDTSASGKRNSTWSNIKAKLKEYFDTLYGTVTGVKGDAESTYRTGNVNITSANIGALPTSGGEMTGTITTPADNSKGIIPKTDRTGILGSITKWFNLLHVQDIRTQAVKFFGTPTTSASTNGYTLYASGTPSSNVNINVADLLTKPELDGTVFVEKTWAEYDALSEAQKNDGNVNYYITDLEDIGYAVQDDPTATDLVNDEVPTGGTLSSVLNSNLVVEYNDNNVLLCRSNNVYWLRFKGCNKTQLQTALQTIVSYLPNTIYQVLFTELNGNKYFAPLSWNGSYFYVAVVGSYGSAPTDFLNTNHTLWGNLTWIKNVS